MERKKWIKWGIILVVILIAIGFTVFKKPIETGPIKIGWVSDLTGPAAKYGAYEAGLIAMEEINKNGGINGRKLEIIFEDGKCNGTTATNAIQKLINIDKVEVVLGGHCTPESLAIAPIAEKSKVVMLASITTSPGLTNAGDYIFRTSPVSTVQSKILAEYANKIGVKTISIIYEQTDYAKPIAEGLKNNFTSLGGNILSYESYSPNTTDFRTILLKIKSLKPDSIFIAPQSPDAGLNILKQINELGIKTKIMGNDVMANQINIQKFPELFNGIIISQPDFDEKTQINKITKDFVDSYKETHKTLSLPYGVWTAESYDAVYIIANAIKNVGNDSNKIKNYLENMKAYNGASGSISFDKNGDGIRDYVLKEIKNSEITKIN